MITPRQIIEGFEVASSLLLLILVIVLNQPSLNKESIDSLKFLANNSADEPTVQIAVQPVPYVAPPEVKGIYLTSYTAVSKRMEQIRELVRTTELNAVVINVNDIEPLAVYDSALGEVIKKLNQEGVHTIARIVVFQNEPLVKNHPELAIKTKGGAVWRDGGGHRWIDPASPVAQQEIIKVSEAALQLGFRELNYDYIRFPSDGAVSATVYPDWDRQVSKSEVINSFGKLLRDKLKPAHPEVILSADIFGHAILVDDDANIGQNFVSLVDYFDVICPMVYPSHYRAGNFGFANPAANPYGVVHGTLVKAQEKLAAAGKAGVILRPWLQDFNLGAKYTPEMVRQQIAAVDDAGYKNGWLLWNARNVYSSAALLPESGQ
jgi:hypothetical protein